MSDLNKSEADLVTRMEQFRRQFDADSKEFMRALHAFERRLRSSPAHRAAMAAHEATRARAVASPQEE